MRILAIGDITEPRAAAFLSKNLWAFRKQHQVDFVAVNAENAGFIAGPDPDVALDLLNGGADVLTGGNHTLQKKALHALLENDARLLRPVNYPAEVPGSGYTILSAAGYRLLVINAIGQVEMDPIDSPFAAVDRVLAREAGNYDFAMLDFHAEATGEKLAMGRYLDGRVTVVYGTHTHIPTADMQVLPGGTGYVTDLGMCGPHNGILGMDPAVIFRRLVAHMPEKFAPADGPVSADGVIFTVNTATGRVEAAERVTLAE